MVHYRRSPAYHCQVADSARGHARLPGPHPGHPVAHAVPERGGIRRLDGGGEDGAVAGQNEAGSGRHLRVSGLPDPRRIHR